MLSVQYAVSVERSALDAYKVSRTGASGTDRMKADLASVCNS